MWRKRTKRVLLLASLSVVMSFILAAALIVADGLTDEINAADVAIVPGNTVEKDGRPYFHVPRMRLALRRSGVAPVFSAHARYFEMRDVYSIAREVVGYGAYLLRADF